MVFSSNIFIFLFLPLTLILYYQPFFRGHAYRNTLLLAVSLGFYAWGEPRFVLILLLSVTVNWLLGLWIERARGSRPLARLILVLTAVYNLSVIFVFKYLNFTLDNLARLTGQSFGIGRIALPIGISFFTFQAISYVVDVYRGHGRAQRNLLNVGLYITFFPQLIAGPIVRYETVAAEIDLRHESLKDFSEGLCRFVIGLAKKVLLANQLARLADLSFDGGAGGAATAWLGAAAYALQIFYDFSGYSDMAIGLGRMFGFHFDENFNFPYVSKTITEFWRRWHISLGSWFRDYVYIPLGGSRVGSRARLVFNLFAVWALTGLWHGASWNFILWGLYFFVFLVIEKLFFSERIKNDRFHPAARVLLHLYALLVILFGWVLFRAADLPAALAYLREMFGAGGAGLAPAALTLLRENLLPVAAALLFATPFERLLGRAFARLSERRAGAVVSAVVYPLLLTGLFLLSVAYLLKSSYNPFIYFNF